MPVGPKLSGVRLDLSRQRGYVFFLYDYQFGETFKDVRIISESENHFYI